jgi:hypothetical protein
MTIATGSQATTRANTAYAVNLKTEVPAISQYTSYPFDRIVELRGVRYGVASDGIYELDGTASVDWSFTTAFDSMGTAVSKNVESLYFLGALDGLITVTVNDEWSYEYTVTGALLPKNHRVLLSKGLKECYYSFKVEGDAPLTLNAMEYKPKGQGRRLW